MVIANLATFMLCFLPLHVALLAKLVAQWMDAACPTIQRVATFVQVASRIANANCCLDAVCYYFVATEFQEEVGAVLARPWPLWGRMPGVRACDHPDLGAQGEAAKESGTGVGPRTALQHEAGGVPGPHRTTLFLLPQCLQETASLSAA